MNKEKEDIIYSGEYVRTRGGKIAKVTAVVGVHKLFYGKHEDIIVYTTTGKIDKENISKHDRDIKNIIEVGDYINGHKLLLIDKAVDYINGKENDGNYLYYSFEDSAFDINEFIKPLEIKSILTHQMAQRYTFDVEKENKRWI